MTKTVPVSFSHNDGKDDSAPTPSDLMIEHGRPSESNEVEKNNLLNEGGDAGTKGTGSAG
jgi:hypothetical protein